MWHPSAGKSIGALGDSGTSDQRSAGVHRRQDACVAVLLARWYSNTDGIVCWPTSGQGHLEGYGLRVFPWKRQKGPGHFPRPSADWAFPLHLARTWRARHAAEGQLSITTRTSQRRFLTAATAHNGTTAPSRYGPAPDVLPGCRVYPNPEAAMGWFMLFPMGEEWPTWGRRERPTDSPDPSLLGDGADGVIGIPPEESQDVVHADPPDAGRAIDAEGEQLVHVVLPDLNQAIPGLSD